MKSQLLKRPFLLICVVHFILLGNFFITSEGYCITHDWIKYSSNPVFPTSEPMHSQSVLKDLYGYKMYMSGPGGIYMAQSMDGISWSSSQMVLSNGPSGSFDQSGINVPEVVYDGNKYLMWYRGQYQSGWTDTRIGLAESYDGINWTRVQGNGFGGSVIDKGPDGSFDDGLIGPFTVLKEQGQFMMLYHASDNGHGGGENVVGIAFSSDGIEWDKQGVITTLDIGTPAIYPISLLSYQGRYHMWYSIDMLTMENPPEDIFYAYSTNGYSWTLAGNDLDVGALGEWDDGHVQYANVIEENGMLKMWYSGFSTINGYNGVGYATVSTVPEPATMFLLGSGILGLAGVRRKMKR